MDFAWLVILGMFLITCFATYGFFLNIEDAKKECVPEMINESNDSNVLSRKLDEELRCDKCHQAVRSTTRKVG